MYYYRLQINWAFIKKIKKYLYVYKPHRYASAPRQLQLVCGKADEGASWRLYIWRSCSQWTRAKQITAENIYESPVAWFTNCNWFTLLPDTRSGSSFAPTGTSRRENKLEYDQLYFRCNNKTGWKLLKPRAYGRSKATIGPDIRHAIQRVNNIYGAHEKIMLPH
jgi:hypothetical protein